MEYFGASPSGKASDSDSDISGVRIPVPQPTKNALLSTDKGAFFELSVPQAEREVCCASEAHFVREVCLTARCAEHLTSLCALSAILHLGASSNFTAACRNFTFDDIQGFRLDLFEKV